MKNIITPAILGINIVNAAIEWLTTSASAAAGVLFFAAVTMLIPVFRDTVGKFLGGFVKKQFDSQLERLRSELRKSEEVFRNELSATDRQIKALSDIALGLRTSRQSALDARRLLAVERLWQYKSKLDTLKMAATVLQTVDFANASRATATDPAARKLFQMFDFTESFAKNSEGLSAEPERPFLTPVVWAAFNAYRAVLFQAMIQMKFLTTGVGKPELLNLSRVSKLVKTALPHFEKFVDEYPQNGTFYLIEYLEDNLVRSVSDMLEGREIDEETLQQASKILRLASDLGETAMNRPIEVPPGLLAERPAERPY